MKKSLGEIMSDPRIWEMSEEEKRRGIVGWFKDRLFGVPKKPQAVMVLDRSSQELLKEYMKNLEPLNNAVAACAVSAEDIKEATDRVVNYNRKK